MTCRARFENPTWPDRNVEAWHAMVMTMREERKKGKKKRRWKEQIQYMLFFTPLLLEQGDVYRERWLFHPFCFVLFFFIPRKTLLTIIEKGGKRAKKKENDGECWRFGEKRCAHACLKCQIQFMDAFCSFACLIIWKRYTEYNYDETESGELFIVNLNSEAIFLLFFVVATAISQSEKTKTKTKKERKEREGGPHHTHVGTSVFSTSRVIVC